MNKKKSLDKKKDNIPYKKIIVAVLIFGIILTTVFSLFGKTTTAYAATCPHKGAENWTYKYITGCSSCGGSKAEYGTWKKSVDSAGSYYIGPNAGCGTITQTVDTFTDGDGNTYTDVTVTYRCYNCGYINPVDGKVYNRNNYQTWNNVISFSGYNEEDEKQESTGPASRGSGAVPWYHCGFCDGLSAGNFTHQTCQSLTVKASDANGGTVSLSNGSTGEDRDTGATVNRYKVSGSSSGSEVTVILGPGATIDMSVAVNDGYEFTGWSTGSTSTTTTYTAPSSGCGSETVTANIGQSISSIEISFVSSGGVTLQNSITKEAKCGESFSYTAPSTITKNGRTYESPSYSCSNGTAGSSTTVTISKLEKSSYSITYVYTEKSYSISVNVSPQGAGSFTGDKGNDYYVGDDIQGETHANEGYLFAGWSGISGSLINGSVNSSTSGGSYSGTMPAQDLNITANYVTVTPTPTNTPTPKYRVIVEVYGDDNAIVTGAGEYYAGDTVTISTSTTSSKKFDSWTNDYSETLNANTVSYSFTMPKLAAPGDAITFVANYGEAPKYNVQVIFHYTSDGVEDYVDTQNNTYVEGYKYKGHTWNETRKYNNKTYTFTKSEYSGCITGSNLTANASTITGEAKIEFWYDYTTTKYTLNVSAVGPGTVNDSVNGPYEAGETVSLVATPDTNCSVKWSGHSSVEGSTNKTIDFVMPAENVNITATFISPSPTPIPYYTVSLFVDGDSSATVTGAGSYKEGTKYVTISTSTTSYKVFKGWYDGNTLVSSSADYSFIMPGNNVVYTAKYDPEPTHTIRVIVHYMKGTTEVGNTDNTFSYKKGFVYQGHTWEETRTFGSYKYVFDRSAFTGCVTGSGRTANETEIKDDSTIELWYQLQKNKVSVTVVGDDQATVSGAGEYWPGEDVTVSTSTTSLKDFIPGWSNNYQSSLNTTEKSVYFKMPQQDVDFVATYGNLPTYVINVIIHYMRDGVEVGKADDDFSYYAGFAYKGNDWGETRTYGDYKYVFDKSTFSGGITGSGHVANASSITSNGAVELWYELPKYTVSINVVGDNQATVDGTGEYFPGEEVTVKVNTTSNKLFSGWTNDYQSSLNSDKEEITFTMPEQNVSWSATFGDKPKFTLRIIIHYLKNGTEVGSTDKTFTYDEGHSYQGQEFGATRYYENEAFKFSKAIYTGCIPGEDHLADAAIITGNSVMELWYSSTSPDEPTTTPPITEAPTPPPTEAPHKHIYGSWIATDSLVHWQECIECGEKTEDKYHDWEYGESDNTGQTTKICTTCGRNESVHVHDWSDWCPTFWWSSHLDEEEYHWKVCTYPECNQLGVRLKHVAGEPYRDGGYYITTCETCYYIMEEEPVTITLTLHPNGGHFPDGSTESISYEIKYNSITNLGKLSSEFWPEYGGKTFTGWFYVTMFGEGCIYLPDYLTETCVGNSKYFKDNGDGTYTSRLEEDYVLYAQWKEAEYTVLYDSNGADGLMFPSYYKIDETRALSLNSYYKTTKLTYNGGGVPCNIETNLSNTDISATFLGWSTTPDGPVEYTDGQVVTNLLSKSGIITLYAIFDYGTIILPNATASTGGHRLIGWRTADGTVISVVDSQGAFKNTSYAVTKDESFTAVWEANLYKVTFDTDGGTACSPINVEYGQAYNYNSPGLPKTEKTGYTFIGWQNTTTNEMVSNDSIVKTPLNHTLKAIWEVNTYKVQLDYNFFYGGAAVNPKKNSSFPALNASVDEFTRTHGAAVGTLPTPERNGYTFDGWYTHMDSSGNGCGESSCVASVITGNTVLYAKWDLDTYTVTFDANGGTVSPTTKTVTYNVKYNTLPTPTRPGYTFDGWYTADTGELVTADTIMLRMDDHTLKASWKANSRKITFAWNFNFKRLAVNSYKDSATDYVNILYNDYYIGLPNPSRAGYSFAGWYTANDANGNGSGTKITDTTRMTTNSDHTLYAKWIQNTYTVTFEYNMDYSVWED